MKDNSEDVIIEFFFILKSNIPSYMTWLWYIPGNLRK